MQVTGLRQATDGVRKYRTTFEREALRGFQDGARQVTEWEKGNHPWRNRTHQAEKKIKCRAYREGDKLYLDNAHYAIDKRNGFKYGLALELRHGRRFAILQVALRRWWSFTLQRVAERMDSVA